ncbi:hypothetical protein [Novipirellula caenicola]|uniref:NHL repeat protein n=1 Tax=Novipirellula caenicola TaxID=1536901 RepID=A0ABP9VXH3_9BACT
MKSSCLLAIVAVSNIVWLTSVSQCSLGQSPDTALPRVWAGTGASPSSNARYSNPPTMRSPTATPLGNPFGIEIIEDRVWITTVDDHCIWRASIDPNAKTSSSETGEPRDAASTGQQSGMVRVAGCGLKGYSGDGGSALEATFNWPHEVRVDRDGNLIVADTRNHVIRRIDAKTNIVTTIAGDGTEGFSGDGGPATEARLKHPHSVVLDGEGGVLIADTHNHRIRRLDLGTGIIETIAGTGAGKLPSDGALALQTTLYGPRSLAIDEQSIWIALREGNSIWRMDRDSGRIHHVAGSGKKGRSGDGGPATEATFNGPKGLVMDDQRRLLVVDTENHLIRRIDVDANTVETVLGKGPLKLKRPHGIAYANGFGYLLGDSENHQVVHGSP